jgi:hypothetical protein
MKYNTEKLIFFISSLRCWIANEIERRRGSKLSSAVRKAAENTKRIKPNKTVGIDPSGGDHTRKNKKKKKINIPPPDRASRGIGKVRTRSDGFRGVSSTMICRFPVTVHSRPHARPDVSLRFDMFLMRRKKKTTY